MNYIAIIGTATLLNALAAMSPGPDFVMAVRNSLNYSRRTGIFTGIGIGMGISIHIIYCALGIGYLISKSIILLNLFDHKISFVIFSAEIMKIRYKKSIEYIIFTLKLKIIILKSVYLTRQEAPMKGGMQGMLKQVQKMQEEMQKVQNQLGNMTVSEEAGGGMIKATANGNKEIIALIIDPQVINSEEKEILEDLVVAAVNKAIQSANKLAEEEMAKVTKGMLPPGLNIPGL